MFVRFVLVAVLLGAFSFLNAQPKKQSYLIYIVKSGETFRTIGAQYDIDEQRLAEYNNLEYYSGPIAAKSLRIPIKIERKEDVAQAKQSQPSKKLPTKIITPKAKTTNNEGAAQPVVVVNDSTSTNEEREPELPTLQEDVTQHLPLISFIAGSLVLLTAAIGYYRYVNRK